MQPKQVHRKCRSPSLLQGQRKCAETGAQLGLEDRASTGKAGGKKEPLLSKGIHESIPESTAERCVFRA